MNLPDSFLLVALLFIGINILKTERAMKRAKLPVIIGNEFTLIYLTTPGSPVYISYEDSGDRKVYCRLKKGFLGGIVWGDHDKSGYACDFNYHRFGFKTRDTDMSKLTEKEFYDLTAEIVASPFGGDILLNELALKKYGVFAETKDVMSGRSSTRWE